MSAPAVGAAPEKFSTAGGTMSNTNKKPLITHLFTGLASQRCAPLADQNDYGSCRKRPNLRASSVMPIVVGFKALGHDVEASRIHDNHGDAGGGAKEEISRDPIGPLQLGQRDPAQPSQGYVVKGRTSSEH